MNVKHEFLRQKVVQERFNAGTFALFALFARVHHHRENLSLSFGFNVRKFRVPDLLKLGAVDLYKSFFGYRCKRCAGAFYIKRIIGFIRGVSSAGENEFRVCAVFVRHSDK